MRRLTISVDDALADTFDRLVAERGYENRSEAFRDLLRGELDRQRLEAGKARECVGVLSYVFNHHERDLPRRLTTMQHAHHDVTVATLHAHLDHDNCIESVILRGTTASVVAFAQAVIAEKGIRHGEFRPIPVEAGKPQRHTHQHLRPYT
ncbi:MAG TPA: nickel-responsive transcriptional regulator NikR [Steroidobacteraceae bacterium]|nr:nickel-responsive transcriptional regulator NikR [Steroidobacteraceae bacterium]